MPLARVVLTNREHVIALEARDKGMDGHVVALSLRGARRLRIFDDVQDVKITKDMLDLAGHIVEQEVRAFQTGKVRDSYEAALAELLAKKRKGQPIAASRKAAPSDVVNLMDALRASLKSGEKTTAAARSEKAPAKKTTKKRKAG